MDIVAALPRPVGIATLIAAFVGIRYAVPAYVSSVPMGTVQQLGPARSKALPPIAGFAWMACWVPAGYSFLKAQHRNLACGLLLLSLTSGLALAGAISLRGTLQLSEGDANDTRAYTFGVTA